MREIKIEELKSIQLEILDYVDQFCKKYNIKYFLIGGTLIGAIRHKGFIPWDDDIDICLLRDDYNRFVDLFHKEKNSEYKVYSHTIQKEYPFPYAKISNEKTLIKEDVNFSFDMGVNIDVFPLDTIPEDSCLKKKMYRNSRILIGALLLKQILWQPERALMKNLLLVFSRILLTIIPYSFLVRKLHENAIRYNGSNSQMCGDAVWGYGIKEVTQKVFFDQAVLAEFEGKSFPIPKGYDNYLRNVYGDYMKLPPADKRISHHACKAYWK